MRKRRNSKRYSDRRIIQRINNEYSTSKDKGFNKIIVVFGCSIVVSMSLLIAQVICDDYSIDSLSEVTTEETTMEAIDNIDNSNMEESIDDNTELDICEQNPLTISEFNIPEKLRDGDQVIEEQSGMQHLVLKDSDGNVIGDINVPEDACTEVYVSGTKYDMRQTIDDWMETFCTGAYYGGINSKIGAKDLSQTVFKIVPLSCGEYMNSIEEFCVSNYYSTIDANNAANYLRNVYTNMYRKIDKYYYNEMLYDIVRDSGYSYASYYVDSVEKLDFDTLMYYMCDNNNNLNAVVGYKVVLKHFSFIYEDEFTTELIILGHTGNNPNSCVKWGVYDFAPANIVMLEESDYNKVLLFNSYEDIIVDVDSADIERLARKKSIIQL